MSDDMNARRAVLGAVSLVAWSLLPACGGTALGDRCGDGTHDEHGACVVDPSGSDSDAGGADSSSITTDSGYVAPPGQDAASSDAASGDSAAAVDVATACLVNDNIMVLDGDPQDYIQPGVFTIRGGVGWQANPFKPINGAPSIIEVSAGSNWSLSFDSSALGKPLAVGDYQGAQRYPFEDPNHPGLDVSGDGRGCNTLAGNFQVIDVDTPISDAGIQVVRGFTAVFEQHCEGATPALHGCVRIRL
jgi:hypothetical protein